MRPHFRGPMRRDFNFEESEESPQYNFEILPRRKELKKKRHLEEQFNEYYENNYFEPDYSESLLHKGNKRVKEKRKKRSEHDFMRRLPSDEDQLEAQGQYEVEMVTGRRQRKGKLQYKIFWKGFTSNDQTWQDYENLTHLQDMIDKFQNLVEKHRLTDDREKRSKKKKKRHKSLNKVVIDESMRKILRKEISSQDEDKLGPKKRHSRLIRELRANLEERERNSLEARKNEKKLEEQQYNFSQMSQALEPSVTEELKPKEQSESKKLNLLEDSNTLEREGSISLLRHYPELNANAEICWDDEKGSPEKLTEIDVQFEEERRVGAPPEQAMSEEVERGYEGGEENTYSNQFVLSPKKKARIDRHDSPLMYQLVHNKLEECTESLKNKTTLHDIEVRVPYLKSGEDLTSPQKESTPLVIKERKQDFIVPKKEFPTPTSKEAEQKDSLQIVSEEELHSKDKKDATQRGTPSDRDKLKTEKSSQNSHLTRSTRQTQYHLEWDVMFNFEICGFTIFEDGIYCKVKWQRKKEVSDEEKFQELPKYLKKEEVRERFPMRLLDFYEKNHYLFSKK